MVKHEKEFLDDLLKNASKSIVGKLCSNVEIVQKGYPIDSEPYRVLSLIKAFNKELVYQEFRSMESHFKAFSQGLKFENYNIYKNPTTEKL